MLPPGEILLVVHPPGRAILGPWFADTMRACSNLRWEPAELPHPDAFLTDWTAVFRLMRILARILEHDCPAPSLVPSDTGGVIAEWNRNGLHLEIQSEPQGSMEHYASGNGEEREGPLDPPTPQDIAFLKGCAKIIRGEPKAENHQPGPGNMSST